MGCIPSSWRGINSEVTKHRSSEGVRAGRGKDKQFGGVGKRTGKFVDENGMFEMSLCDPLLESVDQPTTRPDEDSFPEIITIQRSFSNSNTMRFGSMQILPQDMSVLLVFPNKSGQCEAFIEAATLSRHECDSAHSMEEAVRLYFNRHHSVVIVDTRPAPTISKSFDAEGLCRLLRATQNSEYTVMVAVRPERSRDKSNASILSLLNAGFNRQFIENHSVVVCTNELQCLEHGEVLAQSKLKAAQALLVAVDNSSESVEITDANYEIQYVNRMFQHLSGYTADEIVGKNYRDLSCPEGDKHTVIEAINDQMKTGKPWNGVYQIQRKGGEKMSQKCCVIPVHGQSGNIHHFVSIRSATNDRLSPSIETNRSIGSIHNMHPLQQYPGRMRKESIVRLKSMSVETPIAKVINMIDALREKIPSALVDDVNKMLEVLLSSDVYHPNLSQHVRDDKTTSDLVDGLMSSIEDESLRHRRVSCGKRLSNTSELPLGLRPHKESHSSVQLSSPEIEQLLEREAKWDFNVIQLETLTNKSPLVHLAMRTMERFEVCEFLQIDERLLFSWLQLMEANYHSNNPYHNSTHATDVMHATAYFLSCDRIKNIFEPMDEVAALISAIVHDLDHPGKTNSFLINASADVSVLYNDLAVLESHHVSTAYRLTLKNDKVNIFKNLLRDDYRVLRQQIVDMVLATEMTKHFEHLNRFVSVVDQGPIESEELNGDSDTTLRAGEAKILIKRMLIKCADVSNPARPLSLCKVWADRIATEYCLQTDEEKARGLPVVMPVFDRKSCNVPKSQIGFIDLFINDMFAAWHNFCSLPEMMECLNENYHYWKEQEAITAAQSIADKLSNEV